MYPTHIVIIKPEYLGNIESEYIISGTEDECKDYILNSPYKKELDIKLSNANNNYNKLKNNIEKLKKQYNTNENNLLKKLITLT